MLPAITTIRWLLVRWGIGTALFKILGSSASFSGIRLLHGCARDTVDAQITVECLLASVCVAYCTSLIG